MAEVMDDDPIVGRRYSFDWVDWVSDDDGESVMMTSEGECVTAHSDHIEFKLDTGAVVGFVPGYYPDLVEWTVVPQEAAHG